MCVQAKARPTDSNSLLLMLHTIHTTTSLQQHHNHSDSRGREAASFVGIPPHASELCQARLVGQLCNALEWSSPMRDARSLPCDAFLVVHACVHCKPSRQVA